MRVAVAPGTKVFACIRAGKLARGLRVSTGRLAREELWGAPRMVERVEAMPGCAAAPGTNLTLRTSMPPLLCASLYIPPKERSVHEGSLPSPKDG